MVRPKRNASFKNRSPDSSEDENQNEENNPPEIANDSDKKLDETCSLSDDNEKEKVSSTFSGYKSSQGIIDQVLCSESIPSSDSNKENIDGNSQKSCELDSSDYMAGVNVFSEYDTDQIPLPQLLKMHVKQLVSGFEFGEATKRRAQENMKSARDKKKSEELVLTELAKDLDDLNQPCCSKTLLPVEHKTPHSRKRQRVAEARFSIASDKEFSKASRQIPLCLRDHPDCVEVWVFMIYKEEASLKLRNPRLFNDFKSVTPRMRAILLDWLMEVAAVYHLRRVTYYLSVDYFDRFLSIRPDIPKSLLQLVGITCLYIAAKVEEIYPPNLSEFSYVCDGACKSKEMVSCELLILNSLGWEVVLTTPSDWLNLYMQLHFKSKEVVRASLNMDFNKDFIFPQYSAYQFTRASQLMDLLSLDPGFLKFGYSIIAAAAMYYMYGKDIAVSVSGLDWSQLKPCVDYMEAFYIIIKDAPDPRLHSCLGGPHPEEVNHRFTAGLLKRVQCGPQSENYSFQTHVASMEYFEKATVYRLTKHTRQKNENDISTQNDINEVSNLAEDNLKESLADHLATLEELTKNEEGDEANDDQNLMSFDEIFELILSHDDGKNSNSG